MRRYIRSMNTNLTPQFGHLDHIAGQTGQGLMYGGAATTGVTWAMSWDVVIGLAGLTIAALGFGLNAYFSIRRDARQRELHRLQLEKLQHIEDKVDE